MTITRSLLLGYSLLTLTFLSYNDIKTRQVPNYLTIGAYPLFLILIIVDGLATRSDLLFQSLLRAFLGGLALVAFFTISRLMKESSVGMGDLKISPLFGAILAWQSWSAFGVGIAVCFIANGLWALLLLLSGRVNKKTHLPLIPFMLIGFTTAIFV